MGRDHRGVPRSGRGRGGNGRRRPAAGHRGRAPAPRRPRRSSGAGWRSCAAPTWRSACTARTCCSPRGWRARRSSCSRRRATGTPSKRPCSPHRESRGSARPAQDDVRCPRSRGPRPSPRRGGRGLGAALRRTERDAAVGRTRGPRPPRGEAAGSSPTRATGSSAARQHQRAPRRAPPRGRGEGAGGPLPAPALAPPCRHSSATSADSPSSSRQPRRSSASRPPADISSATSSALVNAYLTLGMTAFDVGANIGIFTATMAAAVGPSGAVHAFEPLPANYRRLERDDRTQRQ